MCFLHRQIPSQLLRDLATWPEQRMLGMQFPVSVTPALMEDLGLPSELKSLLETCVPIIALNKV